ncbi:MAG: DUF3500 domain-containing protein [Pirellulales bacterium]|nr:DUF3500 domain-containing protein [Pirellulales bacterium]
MSLQKPCPDCETGLESIDRRGFLKTAGAAAIATAAVPAFGQSVASGQTGVSNPEKTPETLVKQLYDSLNERQNKAICFDWDHVDPRRGLLRTRVAANWMITEPQIISNFYTKDQQEIIRGIFEGIYHPDWIPKIEKQLKDDAGGYGRDQTIAIFGKPGEDKFEFVMTGRHMTVRCDGNSTESMAFGGPIFYGHAAGSFDEGKDHPGNVYWPQALEANKVYKMLDGQQRRQALVTRRPAENAVAFRGANAKRPGISIADFSDDQKEQVQKTLQSMLQAYRSSDQKEALGCLKEQGGLDACNLAFYQEGDTGDDQVWDNWRIEGPSFVWYFRGSPHVHVWVNIGTDPSIKLNA